MKKELGDDDSVNQMFQVRKTDLCVRVQNIEISTDLLWSIKEVLPPSIIIRRFGISGYIYFTMHLIIFE
jgi:hypothetical protein